MMFLNAATIPRPRKTSRSQGDVPMCKGIRDLLTRLKEEATSNFVFAHHDGGSSRTHWLSLLKKAQGLAKIPGNLRIHDLRHTCASWMIGAGVPLVVVSRHLGHESIETTASVYSHVDRRSFAEAVAAIDDMLSDE